MTRIDNSGYGQEYLSQIKDVFKRMDDKQNGGNGDGKVTVNEAYNDLNIPNLFDGLEQGSVGFNKLQANAKGIEDALVEYAGDDGIFQAEEWADFLNGDEWGAVLDTFHTYSPMGRNNRQKGQSQGQNPAGGQLTKGALKVEIIQSAQMATTPIDTTKAEALIDKYAGDDGIFTLEELKALDNDSYFKSFSSGLKNNLAGVQDEGPMTKGKLKAYVFNNVNSLTRRVDTTSIDKLIDKYAGDDGTFTRKEYKALSKDAALGAFLQKYGVELPPIK